MNAQNTRNLYAEFPELFRGRNRPITQSLMGFGCECGDGWYELLRDLCGDLMTLCGDHAIDVPELIQVKEKFGSLRVYLASDHPAAR